MSAVTSTHDHHDFVPGPDGQALERPRWRDRKRYAWLLGLIVPLLPFISWGLVELTGLGVFWFYGPLFIFGVFPLLDLIAGLDATTRPTASSSGSSRTATTAGAPTCSCRCSTRGWCSRAGCGRTAACRCSSRWGWR